MILHYLERVFQPIPKIFTFQCTMLHKSKHKCAEVAITFFCFTSTINAISLQNAYIAKKFFELLLLYCTYRAETVSLQIQTTI